MEDNNENKLITKNAGRVAWGKKLAKISKELKEKKKLGNKEEIKLIKKDIAIDKDTENKLNLHHIEAMVGIGGLLVAVIALYMQYKNNKIQTPVPVPVPVPINNNYLDL
jgi:butyrate kinase